MSDISRATCLTPPSVGGIAVIQVVGEGAVQSVAKHLRKPSTVDKGGMAGASIDLLKMVPSELKLCHIVENDEVLDDALVCIRRSKSGEPTIDISMHGGPRIVQRVLLLLQGEGVEIVEPRSFVRGTWQAETRLHADANETLLRAKTRRVAIWLARLPNLLETRIGQICDKISQGRTTEGRDEIGRLIAEGNVALRLVDGFRVVLLGPPNSGKSTLANCLAERERAVVSQVPGTTRDWTEHPAAIAGVPLTIVDTAGVRTTDDALEREAINRTWQQVQRADLVLQVIDGSAGAPQSEAESAMEIDVSVPYLVVSNKADLFMSASTACAQAATMRCTTRISAVTGWGLDQLRSRMLDAIGLAEGADWPISPFTAEQLDICDRSYRALNVGTYDRTLAVHLLQELLRS